MKLLTVIAATVATVAILAAESASAATIFCLDGNRGGLNLTGAGKVEFDDFSPRGQPDNQTVAFFVNGGVNQMPFVEGNAGADFAADKTIGPSGDSFASVELMNSGSPSETTQLVYSTNAVGAVPEPGVWTYLIGGVFGVGIILRRTRRHACILATS